MAVTFEELVGSPVVRIADGRFQAVRRFKVAWSDTVEFARDLLGGYGAVGDSFFFTPPAQFPGVPQAICREVEIDPFPTDRIETPAGTGLWEGTNQPQSAVVRAIYRIADHNNHRQRRLDQPDVPEGTYLSYTADLGMQSTAVSSGTLEWEDNGDPLAADQNVTRLTPTEQFTLRWERVPMALVPWIAIRERRGAVNADEFLGHPAETVLFLGVKTTYEFQFTGDVLVQLAYSFSVREETGTADPSNRFGWNHLFRREPAMSEHWVRPLSAVGGLALYRLADFRPLFGFAT